MANIERIDLPNGYYLSWDSSSDTESCHEYVMFAPDNYNEHYLWSTEEWLAFAAAMRDEQAEQIIAELLRSYDSYNRAKAYADACVLHKSDSKNGMMECHRARMVEGERWHEIQSSFEKARQYQNKENGNGM